MLVFDEDEKPDIEIYSYALCLTRMENDTKRYTLRSDIFSKRIVWMTTVSN